MVENIKRLVWGDQYTDHCGQNMPFIWDYFVILTAHCLHFPACVNLTVVSFPERLVFIYEYQFTTKKYFLCTSEHCHLDIGMNGQTTETVNKEFFVELLGVCVRVCAYHFAMHTLKIRTIEVRLSTHLVVYKFHCIDYVASGCYVSPWSWLGVVECVLCNSYT